MNDRPLKILYVAAEAAPFARVGGLADVAGSLPQAIRALGHDVRLMIPRYGTIRGTEHGLEPIASTFTVPAGSRKEYVDLLGATTTDGLPVYLVWNESYFMHRDRVYGFEDDAQRFALFGRAALAALKIVDWQPDVIHANDWHTGIVPAWLNTDGRCDPFYRSIATLFTIHNLAYQGVTKRLILAFAQMEYLKHLAVEEPGAVNWTAQAVSHADLISTVSPRYAQEIVTPAFGMGLDPLLRQKRDRLVGVLNGIDYEQWDPESDPGISHRFSAQNLDRRLTNKAVLQQHARLPVRRDVPMIGMISRLDRVKGIDLIEPVLQWLLSQDAQFIVLGTGQPEYHAMLEGLQSSFPSKLRVFLKTDETLARRIYAGADALLKPSAVEPCGSGQMTAMRYGCVPIVRSTGGLADSVTDIGAMPGHGTGFVFDDYTPEACRAALVRVLETYRDEKLWRAMQQHGMLTDFSWQASARRYVDLYRRALTLHRG
jgi:starch synthase